MFALKYSLSIAYTQALSPSRLTLYTEQIWYGLVLLLGPIEILFVHFGPKIPRIWVALHQMVHVGSSHIETPSIRRCRAAHRFPGQFHRFGIDVHWAGRIGSKELQIDCMGSFLHLRLGLSFHALDRFPKPWKVEVNCWFAEILKLSCYILQILSAELFIQKLGKLFSSYGINQ